jgi:hypothetical protein
MAQRARVRKLSAMELATETTVRQIWEVAAALGLDEEQTMPGLPSKPTAFVIDIEGDAIRGLR